MSVSSDTASMDDALRDTLVVESVNLLHGDLVLEKSRSCAFTVRGLQPEIRRKASARWSRREGRGSYHVCVLSKGIPCIVVIPAEG